MFKLHLDKNLKINRQENESKYNELLNKSDELDFKNKNSLNKKIYFNEKYNKGTSIELCDLLAYQLEKVTKSYKILSENDIDNVLDEIQKTLKVIMKKFLLIQKRNF